MKKTILASVMAMSFSLANAITLFPHFVDVAGDFNDGTTDKFTELDITVGYWRNSPYFYSAIKDADEFLMDTLPFSNYSIDKETKTLDDGTEIIVYTSALDSDESKWSKLYLVQTPGEPLYVGLCEDPVN